MKRNLWMRELHKFSSRFWCYCCNDFSRGHKRRPKRNLLNKIARRRLNSLTKYTEE